MLRYTWLLETLARDKHSSLVDSHESYEEKGALRIRHLVLITNIRLGRKVSKGTNALAYLKIASVTNKKVLCHSYQIILVGKEDQV